MVKVTSTRKLVHRSEFSLVVGTEVDIRVNFRILVRETGLFGLGVTS